MRNRIWPLVGAVALLLTAGCGGGQDDDSPRGEKPPASVEKSEGAKPAESVAPEKKIELVDDSGFRYESSSPSLGLTPQARDESAPPGKTFIHLDLTLKNLQTDRTARPSTLIEQFVFAGGPESKAGDAVCQNFNSGGCQGARTTCEHRDKKASDGAPEELDDVQAQMPAGATYSLRCFLLKPVPEGVDLTAIRLFQRTVAEDDAGFAKSGYKPIPLA